MGGMFSGLSDMLFGSAPTGMDPSAYLRQMQEIDSQIQSLYANAPKSDIYGSPAFAEARSLLAPSADGSLSKPLSAQYNSGSLINAMNANQSGAAAMSDASRRNLSGSSIEAQGVENARMQQTLANSGLLAALYGLQNNNSMQLAGMAPQAAEFDVSQNNGMINARAGALAGISGQYGNLASMGLQQNYNGQMANYQNAGNLGNSLIGAGMTYALMPNMGGFGGGAGYGGPGYSVGLGPGGVPDFSSYMGG